MLVRLLLKSKASSPMLVTLLGMVTLLRPQDSKAWDPMAMTVPTSGIEDGIETAPPGPLYPVMVTPPGLVRLYEKPS
jgi:hypothetical protein